MTTEQMLAWLILEGWEFAPETTSNYALAMRSKIVNADDRWEGPMVVLRSYGRFYRVGTTVTDGEFGWRNATGTQIQTIYQEIIKHEND